MSAPSSPAAAPVSASSSETASSAPVRKPRPMFGIKDLFTTINLMGGVIGICLCIQNEPFWAGISVMLGYLCGDTLDGYVARKLGTQNQFGAEYDTIADHLSHVIAPAAIVFTVYRNARLLDDPWWNQALAIALAGSMIVSVSVRHARNIVANIEFKGVWVGLPRSVVGFLGIAYCNAKLASEVPGGLWLGVAIIPFMSIATLTYWPFPNHHFKRSIFGRSHFFHVNLAVGIFLVLTGVMVFIRREYFFDVQFVCLFVYSVGSWSALTGAERKVFRARIAELRTAAAASSR